MKLSEYVGQKIRTLLNDRRIVVWYDAEGDFKSFAAEFNAPNCEVLSAEASVLKTRRRADEIYRLMNESENPAERDRCLLIYIPRRRGATEDEKMRDPFEVYAMAGAAFGDTEDEKIESLARQAMPGKADEITRLFREGKPDIALLDGLEKTQRWPLLNDVSGRKPLRKSSRLPCATRRKQRKPPPSRAASTSCCGCSPPPSGSNTQAATAIGMC